MGKFTKIPEDTFTGLQLDAGVLLRKFNPANPVEPDDEDIICATTGGINASCVPTFSDLGEDVDNCPNNMKELKHLDSWECKISTTSLGTSPELIKMSLGCADIDPLNPSKIVPRKDLAQTDFSDLWWVGDKADGGMVAVRLINALSTGGFSIQTTKNGKGQISLELTGHVSINAQSVMPMEFYSESGTETSITLNKSTLNLTGVGNTETLIATTVPVGATITWESDDDQVATVTSGGLVTAVAEGECTITASIDGASATCDVTVAVVHTITLDKDEITLTAISQTSTITATTVPADAEVTWESSDEQVATVVDGVVTAVAEGTATITATITDTTVSADCDVLVDIE